MQCVEEGQGSSEESAFPTPPRLLSGSEMKALLQWDKSESHPLSALEKQITVQMMHTHCNMYGFYKVETTAVFSSLCLSLETV